MMIEWRNLNVMLCKGLKRWKRREKFSLLRRRNWRDLRGYVCNNLFSIFFLLVSCNRREGILFFICGSFLFVEFMLFIVCSEVESSGELDTVSALAEATRTAYVKGRWVYTDSTGELHHSIVAPTLPGSGDYSAYNLWGELQLLRKFRHHLFFNFWCSFKRLLSFSFVYYLFFVCKSDFWRKVTQIWRRHIDQTVRHESNS